MPSRRTVARLSVLAMLAFLVLPGGSFRLDAATPQARKPLRLRDKTLVAWVSLAELRQRGGSVLTLIDTQQRFDALVFGEITPGKWMPGSDFFHRTPQSQDALPTETAGPATRVRMTLVYEGTHVRLYRDAALIVDHLIKAPQEFGDDAAVVIGLRHMHDEGLGNDYFHGTITEARLYDRALDAATIASLEPGKTDGPAPFGRWVFTGGKALETTGHFPYVALHGGARIENDQLVLDGLDGCLVSRTIAPPTAYASPIHYRPRVGRLADTIPFYHDGKYHIFYLRAISKVPWEHIVSTDLVHWTELPTALRADGDPNGPDGQNMFTGSVVEGGGKFHIFYVGWNPRNPRGVELIRHATSPDLVTWTKDPKFTLEPDGRLYSNAHQRDFRDPYVFWNAPDQRYWMFLCTGGKTGLATSPDLLNWTLQPPIDSNFTGMGTPECPDYFQIGHTHYLIISPTGTSSTYARHAPAIRGPYVDPVSPQVDTRILYAAKSLFDGKRHILFGWVRDLGGLRDSGPEQWGGTMSLPRELVAGPDGQLHSRPVPEVLAVFTKTILAQTGSPVSLNPGPPRRLAVPDHYLLQGRFQLERGATLTLAFHAQPEPDAAYRLIVRPGAQEAEIRGNGFRYARPIRIDAAQPITVTAFVQGTIIETFINDAFAFSCRAYDWPHGELGLSVAGGQAQVLDLTVKTEPEGTTPAASGR